MTYRETRYVTERVSGATKQQALLKAGFSPWVARVPASIENPEIVAAIETAKAELVQHALAEGLADAKELHESLTEELRGDLADLYNPRNPLDPRFNPAYKGGELLAIEDWPLWARQGGVEVLDEPNMVHSADGGEGSWDQVGRRIKVKAGSRAKTKELLMKHKGVDAMVQPAHQAPASPPVTINIVRIGSEPAQVDGPRQRVIDIPPAE